MGWYTYIADSRKEKPMSHFTSLKNSKSIVDVFFENKDKYMPSLTLAENVLRGPGVLTPTEKEQIAAYTSFLNKCHFCFESHAAFAKSLGGSESDLFAIITENHGSMRLTKVYNYVRLLTYSPSEISKELFNSVIESGVSEEELKEAIAVCAAFNYFNRIVEGHGILPDPDGYEEAVERVNKYGYDGRRMNA